MAAKLRWPSIGSSSEQIKILVASFETNRSKLHYNTVTLRQFELLANSHFKSNRLHAVCCVSSESFCKTTLWKSAIECAKNRSLAQRIRQSGSLRRLLTNIQASHSSCAVVTIE